ncbi:hypothetical protein OSH11_09915 [Kaistia dalseonensis]|uniref:Uncharacterized protein n=1 Tax=Kaistia dalseonensis TaxID=410840 RepID=A0ABU0H5L4_9HYPH|nr:hypothetical protein [Kaistia dalseonensis]MCX5495020.1 hypothetical protein [Kaistia dalseonensis]MDQ0437601.1 hypothetical protein [Kaistia dalseonensis]
MATYRAFYISGPNSSWKDKLRLAAAVIVGGAILVGALILSLSLALILVPIGLIAYAFRRQILRSMLGSLQRQQQQQQRTQSPEPERTDFRSDGAGPTIEADYTVIDIERRDRR